MKKLYSLFALALCAYSVNAQTISGSTACKKASGEISTITAEKAMQLGKEIAAKLIDKGADKIIAACYAEVKS